MPVPPDDPNPARVDAPEPPTVAVAPAPIPTEPLSAEALGLIQPDGAAWVIVVHSGDPAQMNGRFRLEGAEVRVGRQADNQVVIASTAVSRYHSVFVRRGDDWWVRDQNSFNGTFVNEVRVTERRLFHGDRVQVGDTVFVLQLPRNAAPFAGSELDHALPFPLVALKFVVATQGSALARLKSSIEGIESALRFVLAVCVAAIRAAPDPALWAALGAVLAPYRGRDKLSMGDWVHVAWRVASLVPPGPSAPVAAAARALHQQGAPSRLTQHLRRVVALRNALIGHAGVTLADSAYASDEAQTRQLLHQLTEELAPLAQLRLVSVASVEGFTEDAVRYAMRLHRGPIERFPLVREALADRLPTDWCYLLGESGAAPLALAPWVLATFSDDSQSVEIFLAEDLTLGPRGAKVRMRGLMSNHRVTVEAPLPRADQAFYDVLAAATAGP